MNSGTAKKLKAIAQRKSEEAGIKNWKPYYKRLKKAFDSGKIKFTRD